MLRQSLSSPMGGRSATHSLTPITIHSILLLALPRLVASEAAKVTALFTDPQTNISFQRFFGAKTNFAFGIALPTTPTKSFIGMLEFPLVNGAGWGGWSLTGDMEGPLLMAAWAAPADANGVAAAGAGAGAANGGVVSSFRQASNEDDNPPEVTGAFQARPIAAGTSANDTHLKYTFLCEGCLDANLGLGAADAAGTAEMGWALGSDAVRNAQTSDAVLAFHDFGFGGFDADLAGARFADFETWAAMAGDPLTASAGAQPIVPGGVEDDDDDDDDDDEGATASTGGAGAASGAASGTGVGSITGGGATGSGISGRKGGSSGDDSDDEDN